MKRRDLLKGAVGAAAVSGASTAAAKSPEAPLTARQLQRRLDRLHRDLHRLQTSPDHGLRAMLEAQVDPSKPVDAEASKAYEQLVRSTMRTLVISEALSSMPAANREDEAVLAVVGEHAVEMEYAYQGHLEMLKSFTPAEKREIQQTLQREPDLAMDLGDMLDGIAAKGALETRRRKRLKQMVKHATWRLQRQPLDTVVEELETKAQQTAARISPHTRERLRPLVETHGRLNHWNAHRRKLQRAYATAPVSEGGWKVNSSSDNVPQGKSERELRGENLMSTGRIELLVGGILGGVGASMFGIGLVAESSFGLTLAILSLFPITGFIVMMIMGLITLIVGLIIRNRARKLR